MRPLTAYLSGAEDATTDFPFPLTSFGYSRRDAAASYYSATAPFSDDLIQAFVDRPNGKVYVERGGLAWEYFNVGHPIRYDIGPRSSTISLSGTRQVTNVSPASITITAAMVISDGINSTGLLSLDLVEGLVDPIPGDSITFGGAAYVVTLAKFRAGPTSRTLTINAEAA